MSTINDCINAVISEIPFCPHQNFYCYFSKFLSCNSNYSMTLKLSNIQSCCNSRSKSRNCELRKSLKCNEGKGINIRKGSIIHNSHESCPFGQEVNQQLG